MADEIKKHEEKKAAALKYDPSADSVPILTAVGRGSVAENIIKKAAEADVPVVEEASTADMLSRLSVGDAIPPALYEAVAQILVFLSETDEAAKAKYGGKI